MMTMMRALKLKAIFIMLNSQKKKIRAFPLVPLSSLFPVPAQAKGKVKSKSQFTNLFFSGGVNKKRRTGILILWSQSRYYILSV